MPDLVALAIPPGQVFVDQLRREWDAGNAVLPLDTRLPQTAVRELLNALAPAEVVEASGDRIRRDDALPTEPGDALVMATSGTTGQPKGVVLTHDAVGASARMTSSRLRVTTGDRWLACLPVAHIGGLSVITRALLTDTPLTVLPTFDPAAVEEAARNGCTLVSIVTTAMQRIDPALFRALVLGAGNLPADIPDNVYPTYGMTETASGVVYRDTPLEGVEVRVVNGEIQLKSPTLLRCYRDGSDPKDAQGWLHTGDAGAVDADGVLRVFGRMGDMINTGGEKVWPATVERVLKEHPAVDEALVFGEPDPEWGQRVVAHIETSATASADEIKAYVRSHLPNYAVPKQIDFVSQLDRTPLGKLKRPSRRPDSRGEQQ